MSFKIKWLHLPRPSNKLSKAIDLEHTPHPKSSQAHGALSANPHAVIPYDAYSSPFINSVAYNARMQIR